MCQVSIKSTSKYVYITYKCRNKDYKGRPGYFKGYYHTKDSKRILSEKRKGVRVFPQTEFTKGHIPWNIGKKMPLDIRKKMSANKRDEKNTGWKGDGARYRTKHDWVRTRKGRARDHWCGICKEKQAMDWSNKDHKYKRNLDDWMAVCRKCHFWWDKKYNKKYNNN